MLRTTVAIPTAWMMKARLGLNGMRHVLGGGRATALIWIMVFPAVRQEREEKWR
jgi:hypothetical protein